MATTYRIHPAIGIARVGNSPEFFIGPERLGERPEPAGGFKDAQCRVKRQAARFRIFAHHDNNTVKEITDAEAEITWTVHLANRKATHPNRGNAEPVGDLTIDPGARSITGPNQQKLFDNGEIHFANASAVKVPLGEMRSDDANHLLVFGGAGMSASPRGDGIIDFWGNPGWYDDIADGPVSATIKLRVDDTTPPVTGAWVISAPPKFGPHQDSPTTLYDRLLQAMVDAGLETAPATSTYTQDIYPILQRARDVRAVEDLSAWNYAHKWTDPAMSQATRDKVANKLRPLGNMPILYESDSQFTPIQLAHVERWRLNNPADFADDWAGVPAPEATASPAGMDRAALEACVGGAFFPGIEAGGLDAADRPIIDPTIYVEAFRINHATVTPGQISASMALPWQADFQACGENWWPAPRPNQVFPQGTTSYQPWDRGVISMVANWHKMGFVVRQGAALVETERCDTASITLLTPHLNFTDIPQGPMGMVREQPLAITFEVISPGVAVTLEYEPGGAPSDPQLTAVNNSVMVGPTGGGSIATAQFWIIYSTGAAPSAIATQIVTVREPVSGQTWSISIDANTVDRKTAAVALVLDRSGSMAQDRGDGKSKHVALQEAAKVFVDVMLEGDGVGLVRYDHDAQVVQPILKLGAGDPMDTNRTDTINLIDGPSFDPAGATSIGDGIFGGRQILQDVAGTYDVEALAILTDGIENSPLFIADVAAEINERTYAVGLGTPQNTSAAALQTLSGNNGGYLLVTGAIDAANQFLLQKYFLQILSGVSNAEVVLDPDGELTSGAVHRIPFQLTDADSGIDVILLSPRVRSIDFRLQTPNGLILEPWRAMSEPAMRYVLSDDVSFYRLTLPTQLIANRFDQGGVWHALLTLGKPRLERSEGNVQGVDASIARGLNARLPRPSPVRSSTLTGLRRRFAIAQAAAGVRAFADVLAKEASEPAATDHRHTTPYSLVVHSYSNVSLRAALTQTSYEPGARVSVQATLSQSGLPVQDGASVWAELLRPDGSRDRLAFHPREAGAYVADFVAGGAGAHRLRVRAHGRTRKGMTFTREQTLTAVVWQGGDRDAKDGPREADRAINALGERGERRCDVLKRHLYGDGSGKPGLRQWLAGAFALGDGRGAERDS